jgi:regulator of ribonuclease activity A
MECSTSELCDIYLEQVDVLEPIFSLYGSKQSYSGQVVSLKCFEDNALILELLNQPGKGRVLVIDGGGSLRRALIDANIAQLAVDNQWEGIVVYGAVREINIIDELDIGIHALGAIPVAAASQQIGEVDVPINFAGVTILSEDFIYADSTGIILSPEILDLE